MKKIFYFFALLGLIVTSCKKGNDFPDNVPKPVYKYLKQNLLPTDYFELDFSSIQVTAKFVRVGFKNKNILKEGVILLLATDGTVKEGKILNIEGSIIKEGNGKIDFVGLFTTFSLNRSMSVKSAIKNGYLTDLHTYSTTTELSTKTLFRECTDCTLEEVIVTTSYNNNSAAGWGAWLSLISLFDNWASNFDYIPIDFYGENGGAGSSAPYLSVDPQPNAENNVDPKKYTDCFGSIPDNTTTLYTVTISADVPVNDRPSMFINSGLSPGHAFITLTKGTPSGSISQSLGFYPAKQLKPMAGTDVASKLVDDGNHEYQASYTISVSASEFQAAINSVKAASLNKYNLYSYNCTDFALEVFNVAGGNFSIPKYPLPSIAPLTLPELSNTPQGLFSKISEMKNAGKPNTQATSSAFHAGNSKGPCN